MEDHPSNAILNGIAGTALLHDVIQFAIMNAQELTDWLNQSNQDAYTEGDGATLPEVMFRLGEAHATIDGVLARQSQQFRSIDLSALGEIIGSRISDADESDRPEHSGPYL